MEQEDELPPLWCIFGPSGMPWPKSFENNETSAWERFFESYQMVSHGKSFTKMKSEALNIGCRAERVRVEIIRRDS